jgi:iron complex outermembrane receptor protein
MRSYFAAERARGPRPAPLVTAAALAWLAVASASGADDIPEVIVTAGLRPAPLSAVTSSVAVLDARMLQGGGAQQLEEVLGEVVNLNWAGDTSRPRYFQIRGIGELEQYQGAPNPSVGFLIDDIDFSGLGGVATLFDVDRVEVLRGPQGTRYGANALAGLIYVQSAAPEREFGGRVELGAGDYGTRSAGAVLTGPVAPLDSAFRLAVQHYYTDGYYENAYLGRRDTNRRDELTLRGRWRYEPSARFSLDLSLLHVQLDNGYDAFAVDNSRTTQSDQPSVDAQHSTGLSLRANATLSPELALIAIATWAQSLVKYGYDADWGNAALWAPYTDSFTDLQYRNRATESLELRLASTPGAGPSWLLGWYGQQLREELNDDSQGMSNDPVNGLYRQLQLTSSAYRARDGAVFGTLDWPLATHWRAAVGLRGERRATDYRDRTTNLGVPPVSLAFAPGEFLWGGDASLTYAQDARSSLYLKVARGYKAGGFNLSQGLLPAQLAFAPESDTNFELGYRRESAGGAWRLDGSVFYVLRQDAQIKTSFQSDPNNPNAFVFYTGNAARGRDYGAEHHLQWQARPHLALGASLGLLHTRFENFLRVGTGDVASSRELADAPHWQAALDVSLRDAQGRYARLDLTGLGAFYFDLPPNETRSHPYGLAHAKLGLERERWSVELWVRNLFNRTYPVRGFYFGVVPPSYPSRLYVQLGDPRTAGCTATVRF